MSSSAGETKSADPKANPQKKQKQKQKGGPGRESFLFQGILPLDPKRIPNEVIAGCTLAALGIPEVMGYAKIAGMPVITGLYTILIPIAVFAILGSSRHLVVGADSATAALLAAGLVGLAPIGSANYVALAGILALMAAGFLLVARIIRLGFLADFLSRSVLIGFLTGVGIQVAMGQVSGMLGVPGGTGGTLEAFWGTLKQIPETSVTTLAVSVGVIGVSLGLKALNPKIPGALIAVVGSIVLSITLDLSAHGVAVLGTVPSGIPKFGLPDYGWSDWLTLVPTAASIFLVILAQSAATSRAYAAKYDERFNENTDLVGLAMANVSAGMTGTFVVNGSPTKTQMVDGAGGKSQIAQLSTGAIVLFVLLFLTKPIASMPEAVLASIVFLIGVELVDIAGMKKILRWRRDEFVIATATAAIVVIVGVKQGILLAIIMSVIDHLRRSYHPSDVVLTTGPHGGVKSAQLSVDTPAPELLPGLVVYRFGAGLYYANANRFAEEIRQLVKGGTTPPRWLCVDAAAIDDIDFSAGETISDLHSMMTEAGTHLVFSEVMGPVKAELGRYGTVDLIGEDAFFEDLDDVIAAFKAAPAADSISTTTTSATD